MAENDNPNPISFLISKFQGFFNLPTPSPSPSKPDSVVVLSDNKYTEEDKSPVTVNVPRGQTEMPSLKLDGDELCPDDRNTNPLVLWQVYAIGGFFVVRWVLARLNERRNKKKPSDEDPSPNPNDD